jgi:hypothetical protein
VRSVPGGNGVESVPSVPGGDGVAAVIARWSEYIAPNPGTMPVATSRAIRRRCGGRLAAALARSTAMSSARTGIVAA